MNTEYELERGAHVRLLRYGLQGPELTTEVTYEYSDPESQWPSKQHLVARNILSDQIQQNRTLEIIEVASADKWNFNAILNALLKKYSDYSYRDLTSTINSSQPPSAPFSKVPDGTNAMASSEKADGISPPAANTLQPRPSSTENITCPRCQGDEVRKRECTLCGGRGTIRVIIP
jgi:hypothetical protein